MPLFFLRRLQPAWENWPRKARPGWKRVRVMAAIEIMLGSRIMNEIWLFAIDPSKPPLSSAQRKRHRMKIVVPAMRRAQRNPGNGADALVCSNAEFRGCFVFLTLPAKLAQIAAKAAKLATCHETPATMILMPIFVVLTSLAMDAMAPPIAWRRRATKSNAMNVSV